jgi:hypothetical protein
MHDDPIDPFGADDSDGDDFEAGQGSEQSPVALAATEQPVPLRIALVEDERTPAGMVCMGTYRDARLVARCVLSPDAWEEIQGRHFLDEPRQVVLVAREAPPGLQCQLFAMLPLSELEGMEEEEGAEPWRASVPGSGYDDDADGETAQVAAFPLGNIVRFDKDRIHRDNLALEAVDVLQKIIDGQTTEVVDKVLRDLLGE